MQPLSSHMERAMGIEPTSRAWEARILPMNYARNSIDLLSLSLLNVKIKCYFLSNVFFGKSRCQEEGILV